MLIVVACALGSCATPKVWQHTGGPVPAAQFDADKGACFDQSFRANAGSIGNAYGSGNPAAGLMMQVEGLKFRSCMAAHGYTLVNVSQAQHEAEQDQARKAALGQSRNVTERAGSTERQAQEAQPAAEREQPSDTVAAATPLSSSSLVIDSVNAVRSRGCAAHPAAVPPLRESAPLDTVAQRLSQGEGLRAAEQGAGYRAASSFSVKISGVPPSSDVANIIGRQFCAQATNPAFRDLGTWRIGTDVWIALAEPFQPPAPQDLAAISERVLALTNQARSQARRCGSTSFAAVAPLAPDPTLAQVALAYAGEMAKYGYMDDTGRDGSSPQERIAHGGYRGREAGENLARGIMSAEAVVDGWLASPKLCANLMDPFYREMGVAFAVNAHDEAGVYWAMEFGTPR